MKVEIVESETIGELDNLINSVIQDRKVTNIKLATTVMPENKIKYTAMIMLGD